MCILSIMVKGPLTIDSQGLEDHPNQHNEGAKHDSQPTTKTIDDERDEGKWQNAA